MYTFSYMTSPVSKIHRLVTLELSSIIPCHKDFRYVLKVVLEEVVDLVGAVHLLQEYDQFLFAETQQFHSIPGYVFYQNWLETRASGSRFYNQREFALFVFQGES